EILRGLQKMHTRNIIQVSFIVLNFIGMALMIHLKLNLWGMVFVALGTNLASSLTMMVVVHRYIPTFHLSLRHYDRKLISSVMGFSLYAYLITFTNIIIHKTDQLVISIFGSVAMVAVYQISIRLSETFTQFSSQFLDNLGPISAALFAAGDKPRMTDVMLQSNRLMGIITSMLLIPILIYVKPLLNLWLNLNHTAGTICAIILVVSAYVMLFFRSSSVAVMLMADEHKVLALVASIEAFANLILSVVLIHLIPRLTAFQSLPDAAMIGVAIGTLIPNLLLAFIFNIPKACRFAGITIKSYFNEVVNRTLVVTVLSLAFAFILYSLQYPSSLLLVLAYGALSVIVYLLLTFFIGLQPHERCQLIGLIKRTHSL
ncbi:MAG TPA: oligosaccharide flippase family protein, partial [Candidatus Cloacimonadota bacterium]|nr:oligosaccharide flippase family protein [Candidatus Cloacimonadota bacterium]